MPRIQYVPDRKFKPETLLMIERADTVARQYNSQGYDLTLRQLHYQFVKSDWYANTQKNYGLLGRTITNARLAGLIDWSHFKDRGRSAHGVGWHEMERPTQAFLIEEAMSNYAFDLWEDQPRRIEVWVEKEALEQVAQKATDNFRMGYFACKGYVSQTAMWEAAQRIVGYGQGHAAHEESTLILHLGDHDPSGLDMTRDITERLTMFGATVEVKRIALNMDQIEELGAVPNFAKENDPRFADYEELFGSDSWELDTIDVIELHRIIQREVMAEIDIDLFNSKVREENAGREAMREVSERWDEISGYLEANPRG